MVEELFRQDAYLKQADATVTAVEERGVRLDRSIFYPTGGGQPGDTGVLRWDGGEAKVADTVKADGNDVLLVLAPDAPKPAVGTQIRCELDWERRYKHMRMHTALHVMSAVIKGNVTGGQVNADKSRLDFNLEGEVPTKEWVTEEINKILANDHPVVGAILARRIPAVAIDSPRLPGLPYVTVDHRSAGAVQMDHILRQGHRRIGVVSDRLGPAPARGVQPDTPGRAGYTGQSGREIHSLEPSGWNQSTW